VAKEIAGGTGTTARVQEDSGGLNRRVPVGRCCKNRQNFGSEKIADVLEEIWHTADRELPMANPGWCSGLLRKYPSCAGPH